MKKKALLAVFLAVFVYTRFAGLPWGLPYPLHPDERNMAVAVEQLSCASVADLPNCFNPHFFAYGQVPLYLAYAGVLAFHALAGINGTVSFYEATVALRVLSALASLATAYVLFLLTALAAGVTGDKSRRFRQYSPWVAVVAFVFSPYGIQSSHFGTTESLLMLLYTAIVYLSIRIFAGPENRKTAVLLAISLGLAVAIKVSSLIFLAVPCLALAYLFFRHKQYGPVFRAAVLVFGLAAVLTAVLSPQTIISWKEFVGSFSYESSVATGTYHAFYTRQFVGTTPVLFQIKSIFPYALGLLPFILSLLGLALLPWKDRRLNLIRLGILAYALPTSFLFAKWTRFMAPVFPLLTVFGALFMLRLLLYRHRYLRAAVLFVFAISLLPGVAYLSVYTHPDVRFTASEWIYSHIPPGSKILSETANVIDIPVAPPGYPAGLPSYQYASFDFYHLDEDPALQEQLRQYVNSADYIFVPSRRVFMDYRPAEFPLLSQYYDALFSGRLGYEKIAEFSSYPRISLFGRTLLELPDEKAEETWTVFDHPVIRIFKKTSSAAIKPDFSGYKDTSITVEGQTYRLLVAQNEREWEQGLMWVRSKADTGGYDGMVFIFPTKEIQSFWNKNTVTDLDLYWMDGSRTVGKSFLPSIEKSGQIVTVTSPEEADKVVEIIR